MAKKLKVLFVSTEVAPFAKSGGLGDVAGALPQELRKLDVDIRVVMPRYRKIADKYQEQMEYVCSLDVKLGWRQQGASVMMVQSPVPTYFIEHDYYFARDGYYGYGDDFERFAFFCKATLELMVKIDFQADVVHFNDWQTGPGCVYLKDIYGKFMFYKDMKSLFTIHNLQYQGIFGREILGTIDLNDGYFVGDKLEFYNNVSYLKAGLTYSDHLSTVSETYAQEIQTSAFSYGMDGVLRARDYQLSGIVNGIDDSYDPATDAVLAANFSADDLRGKIECKRDLQKTLNLPVRDDVPILSIISRLANQKGFDLIEQILGNLLGRDIQLVVLGTGEGRYEHLFGHTAWLNQDKMAACITFSDSLARKIYAGSDIFIMPSLFEPCGLGQMMAMKYGTLPVVRKTGGLADTVQHYNPETGEGNGFVFEDYLTSGLLWGIDSSLSNYYDAEHHSRAVQNAMNGDFSWELSAKKYKKLYEEMRDGLV